MARGLHPVTVVLQEFFRKHSGGLATLGALLIVLVCLRLVVWFWRFVSQFLLSPTLELHVDFKTYGPWAVVTGCTDGIGRGYAEELARRGFNIALISRSADKLDVVAREIESRYHVQTKCIPVDFTGGPEIYDTLALQLKQLEIGILVNNVGITSSFPQYFAELTNDQEIRDIINVNCNAVTFMTRIVLPQMVERKKGAIINLSSMSVIVPQPLLVVYSASKAYVDFFSRALNAEYKSKGIVVQCVLPGLVDTKMSSIYRGLSPATVTATEFARSAVATIGVASRTTGYWSHALLQSIGGFVPEWLLFKASTKTLLVARGRYFAKQQRESKTK